MALAFKIDSYDLGSMEGTWHGDAVGSAIQELGSDPQDDSLISTSLLKGAAKAGGDIFGGGKKLYDGIKSYQKDSGSGGELGKKLSSLVSLGSSVFSGAFAVAGATYSFIDGLFAKPEPLKLSIELELAGKLGGTVMVPHTQGPVWMCYLPGRFSIEEAYPRGLPMRTDALHDAAPVYDRTVGLFGYAYYPGDVHFRMMRWDAPDRGEWPTWPCFVFPGSPNPDVYGHPFDARQALPLVDRFLPAIYNEYAEIEFAKPMTISVDTHQVPPFFEVIQTLLPHQGPPLGWQTRYRWHANHAWSAHVTPEAGDPSFPLGIQELIAPELSRMDIVAYLGGVEHLWPAGLDGGQELAMVGGLTMQVEPRAGYTPCAYRDFGNRSSGTSRSCSGTAARSPPGTWRTPTRSETSSPMSPSRSRTSYSSGHTSTSITPDLGSGRMAPSRRSARRPTSDRPSPWKSRVWPCTTRPHTRKSACTRSPAPSSAEGATVDRPDGVNHLGHHARAKGR